MDQVKEQLDAVRDFLAGRTSEANVVAATDEATRRAIAGELLAAMTPDITDYAADHSEAGLPNATEGVSSDEPGNVPGEQPLKHAGQEQKERARKLFMDHGYFEEAVQDLRDATPPQQRAGAARALGVVGSKRGTPHLVAAMFDDDPEVRNAAEEALARMSGSATSSPQADGKGGDERDSEESKAANAFAFDRNVTPEGTALPELSEPDLLGSSREDEVVAHEVLAHEENAGITSNTGRSSSSAGADEIDATFDSGTQETTQQGNQPGTPGDSQEITQEIVLNEAIDDAEATKEPDQLLLEEQSLREAATKLERQLAEAATTRTELEKEVVLSVQRETGFRAEAATRRREEEELRKRADEEAETRRSHEREALTAEQGTRAQAEAEAHRIAEEETRMRLESINLQKTAAELVWQRIGIENSRREAAEATRRDEASRSSEEAERRHDAELTLLHNEEEALRTATEEAAIRRANVEKVHRDTKAELERLSKERLQLAAAEAVRHAEATRLRQEAKTRHEAEVTRLRSEEEALRAAAEQVARRRAEVGAAHQQAEEEIERLTKEVAQLASAEAARSAESESIREAEERNRADHEQLRHELDGLQLMAQEVTTRRAEVEVARKKADEDSARLVEIQTRIQVEGEANARAESERMQVEVEIRQQVKTQERLLEEARRRAQEEHQRLADEVRNQAEHEENRRVELGLLRENAELTAQQRAEEERQVCNQVDSLRIADAEARKRIEEAEARRRKSEDVYRLVAERVQRVEAEAHMRSIEEQRILAKLETVRRSAAIEAQARAEQEKRIKEEIEQFRKLESVERPRLEMAALQRTQAQGLFQQQRDRVHSDEATRGRGNEPHEASDAWLSVDEESANSQRLAARVESDAVENPEVSPLSDEDREAVAVGPENESPPAATATIQTYLNSVDPYKRAAAVAELAQSNGKDAFDVIVKSFDDHSPHVRNAAARALRTLEPGRTVDLFNRALEEGSEERGRNIGAAIAASGLATEAIDNLGSDNREDTYNALLILFVMAKAGEVQPLINAIEGHENVEVCRAVIKLLTLSGQTKLGDAALQRRVTGVSAARRTANGLDQLGTAKGGQ